MKVSGMKIGIIGGGIAGLATAWLLEQDHEVILFEKNNFFGGHAQTIFIKEKNQAIPIEIGFEFFNERMYPYFCQLLNLLKVPITAYPFTYSFFSHTHNQQYVLPPIQNHTVYWHSLTPVKIFRLIQLKKLINTGIDLVNAQEKMITLHEFAQEAHVSSSFMHNFFYPLFSAGWGVTYEEFSTFSAYNVLSYIVKNRPIGLQPSYWYEIPQGMSFYINTLMQSLMHSKLKLATCVDRLYVENDMYTIQTSHETFNVDHVIIATDAHKADNLLANLPHAKELCIALRAISYISATLAIHQDQRFMPANIRDWSVANVWRNNNFSTLTIYKKKRSDSNYFRSWLLPGFPEPNTIHGLQHYYHAKPNMDYFKTQEAIHHYQGAHNLWLAGLYTNDIDSHESALKSAMAIAQKLAPNSLRLTKLLSIKM